MKYWFSTEIFFVLIFKDILLFIQQIHICIQQISFV